VEIEVAAHGDEAQESVAALLMETAGCQGYAATDSAVTGYLPADDRFEGAALALRAALAERFPADTPEITLRFVAEEDWADAWKQYFKPQRIGEHIVIKPTWEPFAPAVGDIVIEIDPGMAFGTGLHATTRLCLTALESLVRPGQRVADIGTGSGILAVAAARFGAAHVVAVDNDPLAVEIAAENVAVNRVGDRVHTEVASRPPAGSFDIVVANILAEVILGMADALFAATAPGGVLIASGVIEPRAEDVRRGLTTVGFVVLRTEADGEWVAVIAGRG
jgi:ribosomal protein L11 methyltransferase